MNRFMTAALAAVFAFSCGPNAAPGAEAGFDDATTADAALAKLKQKPQAPVARVVQVSAGSVKSDGVVAHVLSVQLNSEAIALAGSSFKSRPLSVDVVVNDIVLADYTTTSTTLAHATDAAFSFDASGALVVDVGGGANVILRDTTVELHGLTVPTMFATTLVADSAVANGFVRTALPLAYKDLALSHTDSRSSHGTVWEVKRATFDALTLHGSVRKGSSSEGTVQMEYAGDIIGETADGKLVVQTVVAGDNARALSNAVPKKLPVTSGTTSLACGTAGSAGFICLGVATAL